MLVGIKLAKDGTWKIPEWVNRGLDTDVIVSEVRETSRKPDEAYGLIERMCPGGRKVGECGCSLGGEWRRLLPTMIALLGVGKVLIVRWIEIFGRKHNTRPGWLTLGNQLGGHCVYERDLVERINGRSAHPPFLFSLPPFSHRTEARMQVSGFRSLVITATLITLHYV